MNRKGLWGLLVGLVIALTVIMWASLQEDTHTPSQVGNVSPPDGEAKLKKIETKVAAVEAAQNKKDESVLKVAQRELVEAIGGRAGKMLQMATDRNLPITMYGKVVDQYGKPVVGARVNLDIAGGGTFAPGTGLTSYVTDSEGKFKVEASGQDVGILSIKHPKLATIVFETGDVSLDLDAVGKYGKKSSWRTYNTPDNPYIIKAWRVERFEDVEYGSGYLEPVPNGKSFEAGGIVATCQREPKVPGKHWREQEGSWSITLKAVDGGIQRTDDLYLNEAPGSGYQPQITVSAMRGGPDYKVQLPAQRFYYTAIDGQWYGSFTASFDPYMEDDVCLVDIEFKYNPNGSRNLALKPRY
ncbi:hypothetical protein [Thiohalomonas denitrificans]|uniref:hypothetical protein n=1 Tax=Thiohalomonas denitrificans TaxID=415747 RepID=UPI0026EC3E0B|nr:hypothetical protein [Thiohalomonas denitrificans]